eukprot:1389301-Amorphochlora_amoeboformis.AAC.1
MRHFQSQPGGPLARAAELRQALRHHYHRPQLARRASNPGLGYTLGLCQKVRRSWLGKDQIGIQVPRLKRRFSDDRRSTIAHLRLDHEYG